MSPEPSISKTRDDVSKFTDISSDLVYKICQLKQNISVPVAFKLGKFFGNGEEYWLKEQMNYDIVKAEQEINLSEIPAFQNAKNRQFPEKCRQLQVLLWH